MRLQLSVPTHVMIDEEVVRVVAEAENGSFCLLPRHIDFLASLVPGLLSFTRPDGDEQFVAVDEGLLVKQANSVKVSTRQAILGGNLGEIRRRVSEEFIVLDERQRAYQSAVANLEANFLRGFLELRNMNKVDPQPAREKLQRQVTSKEKRKLRARRDGDRSIWFGLGMFGLVGWSVAIPALTGIAIGAWLDASWPSRVSWKVTFLFVGVVMGFANAYRWMHRENEEA